MAWAPLAYDHQDINAAELYAAIIALVHSTGPICLVSDSAYFIKGLRFGPAWCTAADRSCADLWRIFWDKAREIGLHNVTGRKVKSHTTWNDVLQGIISKLDRWGNACADMAAARGAEVHRLPESAISLWSDLEGKVREAATWLAKSLALAHDLPEDTPASQRGTALDTPLLHDLDADCQRPSASGPKGPLVPGTYAKPDKEDPLLILGERRDHEPERENTGLWRCRLCSRPGDGPQAFEGTWCFGQHQLLSRVHTSHRLMMHEGAPDFFFCGRCAAITGQVRMVKLTKPCDTRPAKPYDLQQLLSGYRVLRDGTRKWCGTALPLSPGMHDVQLLTAQPNQRHTNRRGTAAGSASA